MTALQESKLRMLANSSVPESLELPNEGYGSDHDSVNMFQQRPGGWGSVAELMDPDYAVRAFFGGPKGPNGGSPRGLLDIKDWETLKPGVAAQKVQVSAYPDAYDKWEGAAETIINSMSGSIVCDGAGISADAQQLAQGLVTAIDGGRLTVFGAHEQQIRDMAAGAATEQCRLDVGVLQIITFALQHFETLKISSLNRRCTSETPGAGTRSYHWKGQAVDFSVIDGRVATGWDANSLKLTQLLDPYMPAGLAGVGQSDCRADHGVSLMLSNFIQFADGCNHLHVEIRQADTPLNFPGATAAAAAGSGGWVVPAGGTVSDTFGSCDIERPSGCHKGTDLATGSCGSPIWAAGAGTVALAREDGTAGYAVHIDHGGNLVTKYFHMQEGSLRVREGESVPPGRQLGTMGDTGYSRGCHLHFQVERAGKLIDPQVFMSSVGAPLPI